MENLRKTVSIGKLQNNSHDNFLTVAIIIIIFIIIFIIIIFTVFIRNKDIKTNYSNFRLDKQFKGIH